MTNSRSFDVYDGDPAGEPASGFAARGGGEIEFLQRTEGFSGAISLPLLPDLIQIYTVSLANGALTIRRGADRGTIWFEHGDIVHAVCGEETGEEAVYRMLQWQNGHFSLDAEARPPLRSITASWQNVLMEGCRRLDEAAPELGGVLAELGNALDAFQAAALIDAEGAVLARYPQATELDFAAAGPPLAEWIRRQPTLVDCFWVAGDQLHRVGPLSGGRVLHLVMASAAFNVALIRRAVNGVAARLT